MRRLVAIVSTSLAAIGVIATPSAQAESHFSFYVGAPAPVVVAPPPVVRPAPVVVAPPSDDEWYWQPGYRVWVGYDYRWVPGRWVRRTYGPSWDRDWERDRDRWERERWERDRWERDRWEQRRRHRDEDDERWDHAREWRR